MIQRIPRGVLALLTTSAFACGGPLEPDVDDEGQAPAVEAVPPGHTFRDSALVAILTDRPATILFTTNGEAPTTKNARRYEGPISISEQTYLSFIAVGQDGRWSRPRNELYVLEVNTGTPRVLDRALQLDRSNIFFAAEPGDDLLERTVVIQATGTEPVLIEDIRIESQSSATDYYQDDVFRIASPPDLPMYLEPSQYLTVHVQYRPTETLRSSNLVIASDDELANDRGQHVVELWGRIINW